MFKMKTLASALMLGLFAASAHATVVTYNDFSSVAGLTLIGSAAPAATADGAVLRLTPPAPYRNAAAYSTSPITLGSNATFSTSFQFRITQPGGIDPADGFTFVLAANPTGLGGAGVGMGYAGVPNSVAIEFDTYNNAGFGLGNNDGNSSNHVSVDTNGALNNMAISNVYGNGSCGFPWGTPSQALHTAPGCMSNGNLWTATIGYDGAKLKVALFDPAMGAVYNAINDFSINIASILGTNQAYVGFTSGTGSGWSNHDIVTWKFANTTELSTVPEPGVAALLGLGLLGLGIARRRSS